MDALDDAFDLDPRVDMTVLAACGDSDGTANGCGESPTTGRTTGCAAPDGARPVGAGCAL